MNRWRPLVIPISSRWCQSLCRIPASGSGIVVGAGQRWAPKLCGPKLCDGLPQSGVSYSVAGSGGTTTDPKTVIESDAAGSPIHFLRVQTARLISDGGGVQLFPAMGEAIFALDFSSDPPVPLPFSATVGGVSYGALPSGGELQRIGAFRALVGFPPEFTRTWDQQAGLELVWGFDETTVADMPEIVDLSLCWPDGARDANVYPLVLSGADHGLLDSEWPLLFLRHTSANRNVSLSVSVTTDHGEFDPSSSADGFGRVELLAIGYAWPTLAFSLDVLATANLPAAGTRVVTFAETVSVDSGGVLYCVRVSGGRIDSVTVEAT